MQAKRVVTGMALALMAGAAFGHAFLHHHESQWMLGAALLIAAAFQIVSAFSAGPPRLEGWAPQPTDSVHASALAQALLSVGRVTPRQLNAALARQRRTQKRLEQVLLDMRLITRQQLAEIQEKQRRQVFVWKAAGK